MATERACGLLGLELGPVAVGRDFGRRRRSRSYNGLVRTSRNALAFDDLQISSTQRRGIAKEVNGCALGSNDLQVEGNGSLNRQHEVDNEVETTINTYNNAQAIVLNIHEDVDNALNESDPVNSPRNVIDEAVEAEARSGDQNLLSKDSIVVSQPDSINLTKGEHILNNRQVGRRKEQKEEGMAEGETFSPLTVWPQLPGETERWWRIPDSIDEVLPLPKDFNAQLEVLYDKLGCRIHSHELLLRILVHKSYYLSKMPQSSKMRTIRKPLTAWELSERRQGADTATDDNNLMTFADAHGEARQQLALVGDTVLSLAASLHLIRQHPLLSTGVITERRSQLVCNSNLARVWSTLLDLRELVLCDPPLSQSKKPAATSFLELQMTACADTLEAYIGGLYVEKGLESALHCVEARLLPLLLLADPIRNPVALLHERCLGLLQEKPEYKLIGIDNKNTANEACRIRVYVKGIRMSTGIGKSQKLAKRDAAEKALSKWSEFLIQFRSSGS